MGASASKKAIPKKTVAKAAAGRSTSVPRKPSAAKYSQAGAPWWKGFLPG